MDACGNRDTSEQLEQIIVSIERSPIPGVITDPKRPDNPIVAVNEAFLSLTGYERAEVVGRNCRFLAGPGTGERSRMLLRKAQQQGHSAVVETLNYRKDGSPFRNAVMIAPVRDAGGEIVFFIGSQMALGSEDHSPSLEAQALVARLSARQLEVLQWVIRGYLNKQIAGFLGIEDKTVKMHRAAMIRRLGCTTSAEAIRIGVQAGLGGEE
jgi:PAS domain S-box-containing protein